MTKEEKKEIARARAIKWNKDNRERKLSNDRAYRAANLEREKDRLSRYNKSLQDGYFSVYYLPEEHYVGQTNSVYKRMIEHKSIKYNRHVLDVEVLAKFETRKEAKAFEAKLHDMGYDGKK